MISIWPWYLQWLQNDKTLNLKCPFFNYFMQWNWRPLSLKCWHFVASEDIITKFKSQGLYIIKIKYWNASGSGFPPSLIPALRNIGILHYKKGKLPKHLQHNVLRICNFECCFCNFFDLPVSRYSLKKLGLLDSVSILQIRPSIFQKVFRRFLAHFLIF